MLPLEGSVSGCLTAEYAVGPVFPGWPSPSGCSCRLAEPSRCTEGCYSCGELSGKRGKKFSDKGTWEQTGCRGFNVNVQNGELPHRILFHNLTLQFIAWLHSLSCFLFGIFISLFCFVYLMACFQKLGTNKNHGLIHRNFCFFVVVVFSCLYDSNHCFWGVQRAEKLSNLPCCTTRRPQSVESISAGRSTAISCARVHCRLSPFLPLSLPLLLFSVYFFPVLFVFSFLFFVAPLAVSEEVGGWAPGHGEPSSCMEQGAQLGHFPALPRFQELPAQPTQGANPLPQTQGAAMHLPLSAECGGDPWAHPSQDQRTYSQVD